MTTFIVADVGNSRIKWGLCASDAVTAIAALPPDDTAAWQQQLDAWQLHAPLRWVVSGVHPPRRDALIAWLRQRGDDVQLISSADQLPLRVALPQPDRAGIDRLLNAVAVNPRRPPNHAAVIVDAGSAVTVDVVDRQGSFRGGAILPGLRLMAQALHDYTALLPLLEVQSAVAPPATTTTQAMQSGIFHAVVGGIKQQIDLLAALHHPQAVFLTGGDAAVLAPHLGCPLTQWPEMTLEGLRLCVKAGAS